MLILQTSSWCCGYTAAGDLSIAAHDMSIDASQMTVGEVIGLTYDFITTKSIPALQPLTEGREAYGNTELQKYRNITLEHLICMHYRYFQKFYYI